MNWKRGLSEAAMLVSTKVPSEVFEDFLARFGHAINSGQDFEDFVKNESETVMNIRLAPTAANIMKYMLTNML